MPILIAMLVSHDSVAADESCPMLGCGLNGIWLGENIQFHELDANGAEVAKRVVFEGFYEPKNFQPDQCGKEEDSRDPRHPEVRRLGLDVDHDWLIGTRGLTRLRGSALDGAQMYLHLKDEHRTRQFRITFCKMRCVKYWSESDAPLDDCSPSDDRVPLYKLVWVEQSKPRPMSVCGPQVNTDDTNIEAWAVIFRGDHYDDDTVTVTQLPAQTLLFNMACSKTALSKLHLQRHTAAAKIPPGGSRPSVRERQALLKLLTADYCGTGALYTENDVRLDYDYKQAWHNHRPQFAAARQASLDAIWRADGSGAACIDVPRLARNEPPLIQANVRDAIISFCRQRGKTVTVCHRSAASLDRPAIDAWQPTGYAISANPKP